ncbi:MAG: hypothetical protein LWW85_01645 [Marinilabiliales bacterium]|nr:hypothetical protein [Marinilabiliales bacterium]
MALTKEQLLLYMEKPALLKDQTLGELKELVEAYPYFQTARMLYALNLRQQAHPALDDQIKACSVHIADRTILFQLLQPKSAKEKKQKNTASAESPRQQPLPDDLFELADESHSHPAEPQAALVPPAAEPEILDFEELSHDRDEEMLLLEEIFVPEAPAPMAEPPRPEPPKEVKRVDLIEQFIRENPVIQPRPDPKAANIPVPEVKNEDDPISDEFITETLSRIYLKQGHYQKAIDSFHRLSLKFPEKSIYFAQQIEEIKKLIN